MRALNPDQLRAFAEVIELGGFSAAAERLHLTQPAVSQQVRQLERRFSLKLIERGGRKARPTAAGIELLAHARRIEAVMASAADAMARHATGALGRVRIGTGATACIHLLPPLLRDLRGRLPSLDITVATGNTAHILRLLEDNALDVGLVTLPVRGRALSITPVLDDEFVAIASPEAPPLPRRVTPAALAARPLVLYEPGAQTRRIVDQWCGRKRLAFRPAMELGSVEAIKELVGAGLGYYG
ncbi:MAG: LysR family transcriptional regulator, partial [Hyphomicrobiales bacterium]|nr:LysR family transcriptional regulator [Hyphomicrobiales bacterium]